MMIPGQKRLKSFLFLATIILAVVFIMFIFLNRIGNNFFIDISRPVDGGAWCWFQDPRAVSYKGLFDRIYIGWVDKNGDVMISSSDNNTKLSTSSILHKSLQIDDHAAPTILILSDGRIMVFYSPHVGEAMYYRVSVSSEDISSWGEEKRVNTNTVGDWGYTYPNPVQLSTENNKIYLFWRGGNGEPTFSTSIDGDSWSSAQTLFNVAGERPYMKVFFDGRDKIYFTFTDGHPNEVDYNNIYFVYYKNGAFYRADGSFIKKIEDLPLLPSDLDMVYNSVQTGIKAWNWDIAADKAGNPIIVYAVFPTINEHHYKYASWDGRKWNNNEITFAGGSIDKVNEPYYSGGITLDHGDPATVYLSKEINGVHEIEKWVTNNGGFNWSSKNITSSSEQGNIRPVVPRYHDLERSEVIWMHGSYPSYTKYDTVLKAYFFNNI